MSVLKVTLPSTDKTLARILRAPLVKWPELVGQLTHSQRIELSRAASGNIERLALLGEYAETYDSPEAHSYALKKAQRVTAKVRKALGFSYPKSGLATVSW